MVAGVALDKSTRNILYYLCMTKQCTPQEVFDNFINEPTLAITEPLCSLRYIQNLWSKFKTSSEEEILGYLLGPQQKMGSARSAMSNTANVYLLDKARR